jgi:hypothetical protein
MHNQDLEQKLGLSCSRKYELKVNDNRSTMVSVKWEPDRTKVSLHRMFLNAPRNIMDDLACYIKQEKEEISPLVRAFIEDNLKKLDYSHLLDPRKLQVEGKKYNLKTLYDELNREYFDSKLKLNITWFGNCAKRNRSKITFGLYHDSLRLIKIHRMMDTFPEFMIKFVVYHEMLHHVCPSYFDDKGRHHVHSKEFKKMEAKYKDFDKANDWLRENQSNLFTYL